jgi:ABC-2 type transport system permease protein
MTTIEPTGTSTARYGFSRVARMEWVKLASLRSTWWTLAVTIAAANGIAVAVGAQSKAHTADLTNNILGGVAPGLLLTGVLGVLVMTSEYSSGLIRSTLAAAPKRPLVLAAKAAVFGTVSLVVGEIASFSAFLVGRSSLPSTITSPALSHPSVLRAVVLAGAGYCLIGLIGVGLGAIIRHTPAAIAVLVGGVYVAGTVLVGLSKSAGSYGPVSIVANSLTTTKRLAHALSPWAGLSMLCLYAALALGIGGWLLVRRDA